MIIMFLAVTFIVDVFILDVDVDFYVCSRVKSLPAAIYSHRWTPGLLTVKML